MAEPLLRLTTEDVEHIAALARLSLSEADKERLREQLSRILDYFQALQQIDTEGVPPTAQSIDLENVMRDDEPGAPCPRNLVLANAPWEEDGLFRIKAVLD